MTIFGLGLMGGSLARDLAAMGVEVRAAERDPAVLRAAMDAGVVARAVGDLDPVDGVVVLATSVDTTIELLRQIENRAAGALAVTDLGSTKRQVCDVAQAGSLAGLFVGSHPLAGDHRSGWDSSRRHLFRDAKVFLTPSNEASSDAYQAVTQMWELVGAHPVELSADAHDEQMAWVSHLPQIVSTALASTLSARGLLADIGPGGRDMIRLAGSSPEMWTAIAMTNPVALGAAVTALQRQLEEFQTLLDERDETGLRSFFDAPSEPSP